jgi:hypothetical protein
LNKKYLNDELTEDLNDAVKSTDQLSTDEATSVITITNPLVLQSKTFQMIESKIKKTKTQKNNKAKEIMRTTLMLTIVCVLFLITEFPQSILLLLGIISKEFNQNVYMPLGELFFQLICLHSFRK